MAELVKVEINTPKELHDVVVAVVDLIKDFKDGKPVAEIVIGSLEGFRLAVENSGKIPGELKEYPLESAISSAYLIVQALLEPKAELPQA